MSEHPNQEKTARRPEKAIPPSNVSLRDVTEADLPILYEHQRDPVAARMAAFPRRDWDAFLPHWKKILGDSSVVTKAVLVDGVLAGNVVSFVRAGVREVGYWIGREYWGRGVATKALAAFLTHDRTRPMYARVAKHNVASIRVLEKCGFTISNEILGSIDIPAELAAEVPREAVEPVEEVILKLSRA
jgi:RimJ/RimL family protein N-acetyltransferase